MADLRIVDAPEIPTENITGKEKLPTGGNGNYSISLDSLADYTKTKKDLADNTSVDNKVGGVRQELDAHIEDLLNPHQVTKGQIGLGNVDNTADLDKPVSNSTQASIISAVAPKADKTYVDNALSSKSDKTYVDNQLTLKANKADVYTKAETYTKQESNDLISSSISTALTPVNTSLDLAKRGIANRYDSSLTYNSGERVVLINGDIVKSTVDGNTNDPNTDMAGWMFPDTLNSISELISYPNPKNGMTKHVLGSQSGWFTYNSSKIAENDGGTVFNGWERIDFDHITFGMFAADPTATIAADAKIIAAFAASARLRKPLKNHSGTYLLDGANEVKISFDYDLNGTILKCGSNFSGGIKITRDAETVTYDAASALVTLLKTQGVVPERSASLPVLANDTTLNNSFIKIYTNQPYYRYRTEIINRMEINRFLKRGQLLGGFFFSFDCSRITSVKAQKVAETYFNGTGLTVDETNVSQSMTIITIDDGNSFRLSSFKFIDTASAVASNMKNKIGIGLNAHSIEIDGVDTPATYINNPVESNYTLWGGENFDLTFKNVCSDGYGWGATGFNNCRRVTYENCQLSRIDFHKPCHEWLKIKDCTIGNWGILVTMLGDLIMDNPRFLARKAYVNDGIIRSRDDTGGFCNGNLIINNPVFDGDITTTVPLLHCSVGAGNELPSGTPIRPEFFTNVVINNAIEESRVINILLNSNQSTTKTIMPPASINIKGFTFEKSAFIAAYFDRFSKRNEGSIFNVKDSNMQNLSVLDSGGVGTKVYSKLENMSGFNNAGLTLVVKTDGEYDVKTCKLFKYREFTGGWNTYPTKVNILGGSLVNTTDTAYFELESQAKNRIQLKDARLTYGDANAMRNDLHFFTSDGCFWNNSKTFDLFVGDGTLNTATFTLQAFGSIELLIKSGASGALKTDSVYVDISESGTASLASSSGNVNVVVSGTTATITVSATSLRYVGMLSN